MRHLVEPHLQSIQAYVPGLSVKAMRQRFGIDNFVKLASNEGAYGPSPMAMQAALDAIPNIYRYPNDVRAQLKEKICDYLRTPGIEPHHIVIGNGSNEIITLITRTFLQPNEILLNGWPSFVVYRLSAAAMNREELTVPLTSNLDYDLEGMLTHSKGPKSDCIKLVYLGNPNNPTGHYLSQSRLSHFFENIPGHIIVVIDEAYFEYVNKLDYSSAITMVLKRPRTVVLRTFSKIFGLAGLRIGFGVCDPVMSEVLNRVGDPFNVNSVAQEAAVAALQDEAHVALGRANNISQMKRMKGALGEMGLWVSESQGNFVLFGLAEKMRNSEEVTQEFLKRGVIVRPVNNYDLPRHLRVTVGKPEENTIFLSALTDILKTG